MQHRLLLFDIDGTLANSHGSGGRAWRAAARRLFGEGFCFDGLSFAGKLDLAIYRELAENNRIQDHDQHREAFWRAYLDELPRELVRAADRVAPCPGMITLLQRLRRDYTDAVMLGLLTGNHHAAAPLKLGAIGIDPGWFAINAFGDEADTRPKLTALCLERYAAVHGHRADPSRVIVIGDTTLDIHCAKAHGCVAFGVATGTTSTDDLLTAGADVVVDDLRDPSPLLTLID